LHGGESVLNYRLAALRAVFFIMGKQYNKEIKRRRRIS